MPRCSELLFLLLGLATFEGHHVLLDRQRDFLGREARESDRDLKAVLADPFDVIRGDRSLRWSAGPRRERRKGGRIRWSTSIGVQSYLIAKSSLEQDGYEPAPDT
jgi:hypothetical protein